MTKKLGFQDLSDKKVFIGISGGINSAAALCYLATEHPEHLRPKKVCAFYAHLREHSDGTLPFVRALVTYGKKMFPEFKFGHSAASVNDYFRKEKLIPHPMLSPCSEHLKVIPIMQFKAENQPDVDLIGYIWNERKRRERQQNKARNPDQYWYPIIGWSDEDCFDVVKREIGFYPAIYDILNEKGKRVFKHNNCLVCKNMRGVLLPSGVTTEQYASVQKHYPDKHKEAVETAQHVSNALGKVVYWGRKESMPSDENGCTDYVCE